MGLYKYTIALKSSIECDLLKLAAGRIDDENRPFWFLFPNPPRFQHELLKIKSAQLLEQKYFMIENGVNVDLCYGALTSMSRFYGDNNFQYRKRDRWTFRFAQEFFEIQSVEFPKNELNASRILRSIKRKVNAELIDRLVIIHLWNDGFALFINMKGNVHQFHRDFINGETDAKFLRQGLNKSAPHPLFSTIRLRVFLKGENHFPAAFEHYAKKLSDEEKRQMTLETFRLGSLDQIRELLKYFCDFFYRNSIKVCFGGISSK